MKILLKFQSQILNLQTPGGCLETNWTSAVSVSDSNGKNCHFGAYCLLLTGSLPFKISNE